MAQEAGVKLLGGRLVWGLMMIRTEHVSEVICVAQAGEYCPCQYAYRRIYFFLRGTQKNTQSWNLLS